jgi:hypothetical protein
VTIDEDTIRSDKSFGKSRAILFALDGETAGAMHSQMGETHTHLAQIASK